MSQIHSTYRLIWGSNLSDGEIKELKFTQTMTEQMVYCEMMREPYLLQKQTPDNSWETQVDWLDGESIYWESVMSVMD